MPTENDTTTATTGADGQQQQQQQQQQQAPWTDAIPEGPARDHVVAKGYKDPGALALANYNLTRIHTGSGDVIERPRADATPEQMTTFYNTVNGIGADTKYELKFAEGITADADFVEQAKSWFKDAGLRPDQAQRLADANLKYAASRAEKDAAAATAKRQTEIEQLKSKYNAAGNTVAWDQVVANGQKAAAALGLDKAFLDRLDAANGPAVNIELLSILGSKIGVEGAFHDGAAEAGGTSPEAARVELAKLTGDKAFVDSLMNPKDPLHLVNTQKHKNLQAVAYGKRKQ